LLDIAANELNTELDIGLLRAKFEREIHPCFSLLDHDMIAFFHGVVHEISKLKVLYLSSLDDPFKKAPGMLY
jgi:hypothetical protein